MSKIHVIAKPDFLQRLTTATQFESLAEIIWNGFDAGSKSVDVSLDLNELEGIEAIRVRDYGYGITFEKAGDFFGSLGDSWKKNQHKQDNRVLHGKNGQGRFKAFGLGNNIEWITTYEKDDQLYSYKIKGNSLSLTDFEITKPISSAAATAGTEVLITNLTKEFKSFKEQKANEELAKKFAAYLTEYPELQLKYRGQKIDPKIVQDNIETYELNEVVTPEGKKFQVSVTIIEWTIAAERALHLCDAKGISLYELPVGQGIKAPGFNFTAYIKSDFFRDLDSENLLGLAELNEEVQEVIRIAKEKIKIHFKDRLLEKRGEAIERWKKEDIYPYAEGSFVGPVELIERQVFDILAVNVESYLPSFDAADNKSKKLTFKLLSQAVKENPDSVQKIISEVLGLKKTDQDDLADLLEKTTLSSIISSAKIISNRLNFLIGLEALLFDVENKKNLKERDQLHKILENESWIFSEDFAYSDSELRLEEVLGRHLSKLRPGVKKLDPVVLSDNRTGRVDLLIHKANQPRYGEFDYLVVELKRPSQKINAEVITQIKEYAFAVANDERFDVAKTRWNFIAISNEFDSFAGREAKQRDRARGLIHIDEDLNINVWIKTWSQVIGDAKAKLEFINKQLSYRADLDSAKGYLNAAHAKYIPEKMLNSNE